VLNFITSGTFLFPTGEKTAGKVVVPHPKRNGPDERAYKILEKTCWDKGERRKDIKKRPKMDWEYAKQAGYVFEPVTLTHDESINRVTLPTVSSLASGPAILKMRRKTYWNPTRRKGRSWRLIRESPQHPEDLCLYAAVGGSYGFIGIVGGLQPNASGFFVDSLYGGVFVVDNRDDHLAVRGAGRLAAYEIVSGVYAVADHAVALHLECEYPVAVSEDGAKGDIMEVLYRLYWLTCGDSACEPDAVGAGGSVG
jgi:hypothetical protein